MINILNDFVDQLLKYEKFYFVDMCVFFVIKEVFVELVNKFLKVKDLIVIFNGQEVKYYDQVKVILNSNKGKIIFVVVLCDLKQILILVSVFKDGKLGVIVGGLGIDLLEKLGYYKVSIKYYGFFEFILVGLEKGKDQLVGYGK